MSNPNKKGIQRASIQPNSITGHHIKVDSIEGRDIKDGTIESVDIKERTIQGIDIALNTVENINIRNNTIIDDNIANNANINPNKLNLNIFPQETILGKMPVGLFISSIPTDINTAIVRNNHINYSFINPIYLQYQLEINYLRYIMNMQSNNGEDLTIALYDIDGNKIFDNIVPSNNRGSQKIPIPKQDLLPGFYFILVKFNSTRLRLIGGPNIDNAIIPQRGIYIQNSSNPSVPNNLTFSNISEDVIGQPWIILSKF